MCQKRTHRFDASPACGEYQRGCVGFGSGGQKLGDVAAAAKNDSVGEGGQGWRLRCMRMRGSVLKLPAALMLTGCCGSVERRETVDMSGITRARRCAQQHVQTLSSACGGSNVQRRAALDFVCEINICRAAGECKRLFVPVQQVAQHLQILGGVSGACQVQRAVTGGVDHGRSAAKHIKYRVQDKAEIKRSKGR